MCPTPKYYCFHPGPLCKCSANEQTEFTTWSNQGIGQEGHIWLNYWMCPSFWLNSSLREKLVLELRCSNHTNLLHAISCLKCMSCILIIKFTMKYVNVTGLNFKITFVLEKRAWGRCIVYKSSGRIIGASSRGRGVLPFCMGRTRFKLAVTSSNQFLPVVAHDKWTV